MLAGHRLFATQMMRQISYYTEQCCCEFCVFVLRYLMRHGDLYQALYEDIVPGGNNEASVKDFYRTLQKGSGAMAKVKAEQQDGYCLTCKAKKTMKDAHTSTINEYETY
jgi:hypothetical protein